MRRFRWLGAGTIPAVYDLRRCGWTLSGAGAADVTLADLSSPIGRPPWPALAVGIADPVTRAQVLRAGFGDAVGREPALPELEARALRLCELLPRQVQHDGLRLDLEVRDAFADGKALGLHPREFALLWRLMATPGEALGKLQLIREVWGLRYMPKTNSLAVHACRLRAKLGAAGLDDLIVTTGDGYRLAPEAAAVRAVPLHSAVDAAGPHPRLTDDPPLYGTLPA